jgi:hypothetical protein
VIGIAGILVDQAFEPSEVMITDLEDHLELIRSNVLRNPCKTVKVSQYDWCHPPELGTYDIVLAFEWLLPPCFLSFSLAVLSLSPAQCLSRGIV